MPSALPNPANDYRAPPAPERFALDRESWDPIFTSIGGRLRALEDVNSGIETLKLELQNFGIQRLDEAINPLIEQTQQSLATLQAAVATAQQELSDTVEDANAAFAAALAAASQSIAGLQETLDQMLAGGVPAANVAITAIDGLAATNSQAAFAELVADLDALADSVADSLAAVSFATTRPHEVKTANFAAAAFRRYRCETGAGAITVALPAAPADGTIITVRRKGTSNVIVARNGRTIAGSATDLTIDADKREIDLKYNATTSNWEVEARAYA